MFSKNPFASPINPVTLRTADGGKVVLGVGKEQSTQTF